MNKKLENIKDLVAKADIDTWNILTALRGPDSDMDKIKYITTAVIRHMVGMRRAGDDEINGEIFNGHSPTGSMIFSLDEAWERLGSDINFYKARWKNATEHFRNHIRNAQMSLSELGHPDAIRLGYILDVLMGARTYHQTIDKSKYI